MGCGGSCIHCQRYDLMVSYQGCGGKYNDCDWSTNPLDGPPNTAWLQSCFPNADVNTSALDDWLPGCDLANAECPAEITEHMSIQDRNGITHVGFNPRCGSHWGDQFYLPLERDDQLIAKLILVPGED